MHKPKHPMQPLITSKDGVRRFKPNALVRYLLDAGPFDMNHLALIPVDNDDRQQFAQLIGYSVDGYSDLSYADSDTIELIENSLTKGETK